MNDAPALWAPSNSQVGSAGITAVSDLDGDGVGDLVQALHAWGDPYDVSSYVFLGPMHGDLVADDADAVFTDDPVGRPRAYASAACPGRDGGAAVVVTLQDADDVAGLPTRHRLHSWRGAGVYGDDSVDVEIGEPSLGGYVLACGGDLDDDGFLEMVSVQESDSYPVDDGDSLALLFEAPDGGTWELGDLAHVNLFAPERDDALGRTLGQVLDTDFDGDGVDDLVVTTAINPPSDGIGEQMMLLRYAGQRTGL